MSLHLNYSLFLGFALCLSNSFAISNEKNTFTPSFIGIAAGTYTVSPGPFFPLIAATHDNGLTWNYPRSVLDDLKTSIDPSFTFGLLRGATCTGIADKGLCLALGSFCQNEDCSRQVPLVALGKNQLSNWTFPHSVFQNLSTQIDPNLARTFFINGSCLGEGNKAFCTAKNYFSKFKRND